MKKLLLSLFAVFTVFATFAQNGTLTTNPSTLTTDYAAGSIVLTYNPTGSSLNASSGLNLYMWVGSKNTGWTNHTYAMTSNGNGTYSYNLNIQSVFALTSAEVLSLTSIGIIIRDGSGGQTGNFEFNIVPGTPGVDKFKFDFGPKEGATPPWESINLTDSGDGNKFTASITIPSNYTDYRAWVGYNNGGQGDAGWIAGKSADVNFDNIPGIAAGKMILIIYKNSLATNWGIQMEVDLTTGIGKTNDTNTFCTGSDNTIYAKFDGKADIEVYAVNGILINRQIATDGAVINVQSGLYIVKINNQAFKVNVK